MKLIPNEYVLKFVKNIVKLNVFLNNTCVIYVDTYFSDRFFF